MFLIECTDVFFFIFANARYILIREISVIEIVLTFDVEQCLPISFELQFFFFLSFLFYSILKLNNYHIRRIFIKIYNFEIILLFHETVYN